MDKPPLTLQEYLDRFDPLSEEDIGPYIPADGATLRYSICRVYRDGRYAGGGSRKGHIGRNDLINDSFITEDFSRMLSLQELQVGVIHCTYGDGNFSRDMSEDEHSLLTMGALYKESKKAPESMHVIRREDIAMELPPVSPLTKRGISRFFTAAADIAESMGFQLDGIVDDGLQISYNGIPVALINEDGCGSHIYTRSDQTFKVLFPTGPFEFFPKSFGQEGALSDKLCAMLNAVKSERASIQEYLYSNDYEYAARMENTPAPLEHGPTMSL